MILLGSHILISPCSVIYCAVYSRFIDSEADLDSAIKSMFSLSQAPVLAYPELVRSGAVALLIGLLAHENVDIAIDVIELIHELTDEDVGNDLENDEALEETEAALKLLIDSLVRSDHFLGVVRLTRSLGRALDPGAVGR